MADALLNTLLDYGALGLFAAFMVWQHLTMTRRQHEDQRVGAERAEKTQAKFDERLNELIEKYEAREDALRERYDSVLKEYQERHAETKDLMASKLQEIHLMIETGLGEMRRHYEEAKLKELTRQKPADS